MTEANLPSVSVVIPAVNGWADLDRCLGALERERGATPLEAIVPERTGAAVRAAASQKYPWAKLIPVPGDTTIPQMRAAAIRGARASTVVVIEDHIVVPPGWARAMADARTSDSQVIGGGLVNSATDNVVDWAAWLCEYSHLAGPAPVGEVSGIHGNHTAYDRALLVESSDIIESGRWEDVLHDALRKKGVKLWSRPDIVANHEKHYTVGEYFSQRFLYSRAYAAMRSEGSGTLRRLVYGLVAFTLPPVLFYRIVSRVWRGRIYRDHLRSAVPLIALFVCSWALGEVAGAWFGDGGALARVA